MNLDSTEEIKKIDTENVLGSIDQLSDQVLHAWEDANNINVPDDYRNVKNVVMCGMGGSGLGARIIESVYSKDLKIPLLRINDYHLPEFVDLSTLVICSSYSGETEETIQNANEAIDKNAKWMAIANGGKLLRMAQENNVPFYDIDPKFNPSNQPRMAIGYSVIGQMVLAAKAGLFSLQKEEIIGIKNCMKHILSKNNLEIKFFENDAKTLAGKLRDKIIIYVASGHLVGAMHTVNNQLNENAKNLSIDAQIPELNHHLLEGLKHPEKNKENLFMIFVNSNLYPERIKQRMKITRDVVEQNGIETYTFEAISDTKLSQSFELIQFGAYVNYYLSMLYDQNPSPIPWVDYFKEKLGQPLGK